MHYDIKAHPTEYKGVIFRSRLEARWAAFFDLAGWTWEYEPFDLPGWSPDFDVSFPCGHSECGEAHRLLVEVKPYFCLDEFAGHPSLEYPYGGYPPEEGGKGVIPADSSAAFGINPRVTWWEMGHGAGGGEESIEQWVGDRQGLDVQALWDRAGYLVRYQGPRR